MRKSTFCLVIMALLFGNTHATIGKKYDKDTYEVAPVAVNTHAYEFGISNYRNNTVAYFVCAPSVATINDKDLSKDSILIYQATIDESGNLFNAVVCKELMDLGVSSSFAYDKKTDKIYFAKYLNRDKVYQLYESAYSDGKWSDAQLVKIKNLTPGRKGMSAIENANWDYLEKGASLSQPTLAKGGTRIYFTSNLKGGQGKTDIWYIDNNGEEWSAPVNAGKNINTAGSEQYPFVSGDSVLYYASNFSGEGQYDLFAARISSDSIVSENLGTFFNTSANEYNLITNGNNVYFVSGHDADKKDEIMYIKLKLIIVPEVASVPESQPVIEQSEFHHVLFLFDYDKSNLKSEFAAQIDQIVEDMNQFPGQKFEIDGHADARGSDEYNDKLSYRRAKTVYDLLVKKGIAKDRLVIKAYGKKDPAVAGESEEAYAQNRRVEINIYNENK